MAYVRTVTAAWSDGGQNRAFPLERFAGHRGTHVRIEGLVANLMREQGLVAVKPRGSLLTPAGQPGHALAVPHAHFSQVESRGLREARPRAAPRPTTPYAAPILSLQRTIGNRSTSALLSSASVQRQQQRRPLHTIENCSPADQRKVERALRLAKRKAIHQKDYYTWVKLNATAASSMSGLRGALGRDEASKLAATWDIPLLDRVAGLDPPRAGDLERVRDVVGRIYRNVVTVWRGLHTARITLQCMEAGEGKCDIEGNIKAWVHGANAFITEFGDFHICEAGLAQDVDALAVAIYHESCHYFFGALDRPTDHLMDAHCYDDILGPPP